MNAHHMARLTSTPRFPAHSIAGRAGASFKPQHIAAILADGDFDGFLEVHAENYMGDGGAPHAMLAAIRERHPLSLHGVCMSIGAPRPLDRDHLQRFSRLVERYEPALVSEHLAWSTHDDVFYNDLLPLPYTKETLATVCQHVDEVQTAIGRTLMIENPSSYLVFRESTYAETDFIREMARRTGCGLLLDINNVFVSATNLGTSPMAYLDDFPIESVGEIHLAGHDAQTDDEGDTLLIDTHDRAVSDPVWALYAAVIDRRGPVATLVEWDSEVPEWPVLATEARAARAILQACGRDEAPGGRHAVAR